MSEAKPRRFDYRQGEKFWDAFMESKRAEAMASIHHVPTEIRRHEHGSNRPLSDEHIDKQVSTIATFLRDIADALERK